MRTMRKMIKAIAFGLLLLALLVSSPIRANAASNPYGMYQEMGNVRQIRCTYVAWQQAYERTGVALPAWGNGGTWLASAQNPGYSTGSEPQADSIAVFKGVYANAYGHVAYVTAVNGSKITVIEGGSKEYATTGSYNSAVGSTLTWTLDGQT